MSDLHRFPSEEVVRRNADLSWRYVIYIQQYKKICPPYRKKALAEVEIEAGNCHLAWQYLQNVYDYNDNCNLHELKELIGDDNYFHGRMPLPVPIHRFHRQK